MNTEIINEIAELNEQIGKLSTKKIYKHDNARLHFDIIKDRTENYGCYYKCRCCSFEVRDCFDFKMSCHAGKKAHERKSVEYNKKIDDNISEIRNKIFLLQDELQCIELKSQ